MLPQKEQKIKNRLLQEVTYERYKRINSVWRTQKVGFFALLARLVVLNLMISGYAAILRFGLGIAQNSDIEQKWTWLNLRDGWAWLGEHLFFALIGLMVLASVVILILALVYARKNLQFFLFAWEVYLALFLICAMLISHVLIMCFVPEITTHFKAIFTLLFTLMYGLLCLTQVRKKSYHFFHEESSAFLVKVNDFTRKVVGLICLLYPVIVVLKNVMGKEKSQWGWIYLVLVLVIHIFLYPLALGYQTNVLLHRYYFLKYREDFKEKFKQIPDMIF